MLRALRGKATFFCRFCSHAKLVPLSYSGDVLVTGEGASIADQVDEWGGREQNWHQGYEPVGSHEVIAVASERPTSENKYLSREYFCRRNPR